MKHLPKITFGIIVLNGEPFLRYCLEALYPFAHEIIVVEGACLVARSLATPGGHSTDGTVEMLRRFKTENDPEKKLILVFGEDDGKPSGFWSEKDEMSQAYAGRATGDWLWQVDYDEFYLERDMRTMLAMLASDPDITAVSFPYRQFWGGFDYVETGQWFKYEQPCCHRLFRWGPGYRYVKHRPPTVLDEKGRDLRTQKWITHRQMRRAGIYLYHYSYVLPKQAREKVDYYKNVTWSDEFRNNEAWLREKYHGLKTPYFIGEGGRPKWLERYRGQHPFKVLQLQQDQVAGRLNVELRPTEDIEKLLGSTFYASGKLLLRIWLFVRWYLIKCPVRAAKGLIGGLLARGKAS
jgi:glycosyltransferase involved in cell wall biosynthesis